MAEVKEKENSKSKTEADTKSKKVFNSIAVLDRPVEIENELIYGVLYDAEEEKEESKTPGHGVEPYINYLVATERWERNGGHISAGGEFWELPDGIHTFECNHSFERIVSHLMKGEVKISRFEFDRPIECMEGEVLRIEPRIVLSRELIDRYTKDIQYNQVEE